MLRVAEGAPHNNRSHWPPGNMILKILQSPLLLALSYPVHSIIIARLDSSGGR